MDTFGLIRWSPREISTHISNARLAAKVKLRVLLGQAHPDYFAVVDFECTCDRTTMVRPGCAFTGPSQALKGPWWFLFNVPDVKPHRLG